MKIEISFAASADRRARMERQAMSLTKSCPIDRNNPDHCPLCELRLLPARERKLWVQSLTMEELDYLMLYHHSCASLKTHGTFRPRKIFVPT
jgi:hypothetical protein